MSLKDTWKNKTDGVDDVLADDINNIAQAVIQNENDIIEQDGRMGNFEEELSEKADISQLNTKADKEDTYTKEEVDTLIGESGGMSSNDIFTTIANITVEEAVNAITIDETSFPDITKVKDFYIAFSIAKPETVQSGNLLIKSKTKYAVPYLGVIKTWNHTSYVMTGNFYSKWFDNGFRFNSCAETLGANNTIGINLTTTIAQINEPLQAITIQCDTATSLIPAGSKITIRGYVGK